MQKLSNPQLDKLPNHLRQYIKPQEYKNYTAIDHAVWRYVMRINVNFLSKVAHPSYLVGLKKAGLEIDTIAHMYGMNRILQDIGWAAVAVDGFIPPAAFMEFQAYNVLVIAADIRQLNHIEYTPAPDIIHEAAGHAPIIADPEYSTYLRLFGEIGSKAFSSSKDFELYEAIRHLSIIKEYPFTPQENILKAEEKISKIQSNMGEPSEMALIRRLHWWTVEYGLIGTLKNPKIYGAGLLSSIGESVTCLKADVKKIPLTIDAINYEFDITKPQPQLFVTPDFAHLTKVLLEFSELMALKKGGSYGLSKAKQSENTSTIELSSGLQISGTINYFLVDENQNPVLIKTKGPTALAFQNLQLAGFDKQNFREGFIVLVQGLENSNIHLENATDHELMQLNMIEGKSCSLNFKTGIKLSAQINKLHRAETGKLIYITMDEASLFIPSIGTLYFERYIFTVGASVSSVFSGAADKNAFNEVTRIPAEGTYKVVYDNKTKRLQELYADVRQIRNMAHGYEKLNTIFYKIQNDYGSDWLLALEIYEILVANELDLELRKQVKHHLEVLQLAQPQYKKLIIDGLSLIESEDLYHSLQ